MKEHYQIRSDFADELDESKEKNDSFTISTSEKEGIKSSYIRVLTKENSLHKEVGDYVSIQFDQLFDHEKSEQIISEVCKALHAMMEAMHLHPEKILVVGLGNRMITSDALGPSVVRDVLVTAHYYAYEDQEMLEGTRNVAAIQPGVMGQTGLESLDVVKSVVQSYQPDVVFAIDALATRNLKRINRVIQINTTGIQPGSGVGNHRKAFNQETLGVPVIAMGIATVTSIGAIVSEALDMVDLAKEEVLQQIHEQNHLDLVVTPKAMDDELKHLAYLLSESINRTLHPQYLQL